MTDEGRALVLRVVYNWLGDQPDLRWGAVNAEFPEVAVTASVGGFWFRVTFDLDAFEPGGDWEARIVRDLEAGRDTIRHPGWDELRARYGAAD